MLFKILAVENVHFKIIKSLRNQNIEIISVIEDYRGLSDFEILKLARELKAILLTEDSDFGEWIFSFKEENIGIIFLRYNSNDVDKIILSLKKLLESHKERLYRKFVVITKNKIRIREILE